MSPIGISLSGDVDATHFKSVVTLWASATLGEPWYRIRVLSDPQTEGGVNTTAPPKPAEGHGVTTDWE